MSFTNHHEGAAGTDASASRNAASYRTTHNPKAQGPNGSHEDVTLEATSLFQKEELGFYKS